MIPIYNIYYMLSYAFRLLQEQGYRDVATEDFHHTGELLAAILCKGVAVQLKRGLYHSYFRQEGPLAAPRGKLEISASLKTPTLYKKQLICTYDEFSPNAYLNRILKTTLLILLRADISKERKKAIRKLLVYFAQVDPLKVQNINWQMQYERNNQTYRMLIEICRLVLQGLLQTTADGATRIMHYLDDMHLSKLYEKFILGYYQHEHPEMQVSAPQIAWQVTAGNSALLPRMQTDVVLYSKQNGKRLIIDAKFYGSNLQKKAYAVRSTLLSAHLYQIFTYVKNWPATPDESVAGMLLYAKTDADEQPEGNYIISGHPISVTTLDLSGKFQDIAAKLDAIATQVTT